MGYTRKISKFEMIQFITKWHGDAHGSASKLNRMKWDELNRLCGAISHEDKQHLYEVEIEVVEPNIYGEYIGDPYIYTYKANKPFDGSDIRNAVYQICEIERVYKGRLYVRIMTTIDGEYHDSDEGEVIVSMQLTNEKTPFVDWNKCSSELPPIYKIDREKSSIKILF